MFVVCLRGVCSDCGRCCWCHVARLDQVFPKLKAWAASRHIALTDVDLRRNTDVDKTTVEACLEEMNRADVFVGILGSKYGDILPGGLAGRPYLAPPDPEHDWLLTFPAKLGLADIEAARVALNKTGSRSATVRRALFYERDSSFTTSLPFEVRPNFLDGDVMYEDKSPSDFVVQERRAALLESLKARLRECAMSCGRDLMADNGVNPELMAASGQTAPDPLWYGAVRYCDKPFSCAYVPATAPGEVPQVGDLSEWGARVFRDLQDAVESIYPIDSEWKDDPLATQRLHHIYYGIAVSEGIMGRDSFVTSCMTSLRRASTGDASAGAGAATSGKPGNGPLVLVGDGGVGKTAVMGAIVKAIEANIYAESATVSCGLGLLSRLSLLTIQMRLCSLHTDEDRPGYAATWQRGIVTGRVPLRLTGPLCTLCRVVPWRRERTCHAATTVQGDCQGRAVGL